MTFRLFVKPRKNKDRMKRYLIFSVLAISSLAGNPFHHCYAPFLGHENATEYYTQLIHKAAHDFGYHKTIPVKQMNTVLMRLVRLELHSFTMFGVWLNQSSLDQCDESVRQWILYHEVAHYLAGHHLKVLGLLSLVGPFIGMNYSYVNSRWGKLLAGVSSTLCLIRLYSYVLKPYVREQEKDADLRVLRLWHQLKRDTDIIDYLDYLNQCIQNGEGAQTDGWHYTIQEQYEYLSITYNALKIS